MKVKEIMQRDVGLGMINPDDNQETLDADAFCFEEQNTEQAARFMRENNLGRLAVINRHGRFVGVVSIADILAADNPMQTSNLMKNGWGRNERRIANDDWPEAMDRRQVAQ